MQLKSVALFLMAFAAGAFAQTAVTTTAGGSAGSVPVFTSSNNVENSAITQENGEIGIGTTSPVAPLQVNGATSVNTVGGIIGNTYEINGSNFGSFGGYSSVGLVGSANYAATPNLPTNPLGAPWASAGVVGIGAGDSGSAYGIGVAGFGQSYLYTTGLTAGGKFLADTIGSLNGGESLYGVYSQADGTTNSTSNNRVYGVFGSGTGGGSDVTYGGYFTGTGGGTNYGIYSAAGTNYFNGSVGIGATNPQYALDVAGQIRSSSGGVVFPDGTTQVTAFIPANCGADFAEAVDVTGKRIGYQPGDVLVIDPDHAGKFLEASQAYSTMVAGIYSTKPGFVGRLYPAADKRSAGEVPMAMVGRVPTKVTTEDGPIHVGDLLVSSSTPGYAMRGTDRSRMLGAVIGKALGSLDSGTGMIEVLVTLQ